MKQLKTLLGNGFKLGPRGLLAAALAVTVLGLAAAPAQAATVVVNTTLDQEQATCPTDCSLRDAIFQSNPGDTIMIPAGTYVLTLSPFLGAVAIPQDLTLIGAGARTTVIDGNNGSGVFRIDGGSSVTIRDLSVVNSLGQSAIVASRFVNALSLTGLTIANNRNGFSPGSKGGGVSAFIAGTIQVQGCTFSNNVAGEGGGLYVDEISSLSISDSTFFGNDAHRGSAISVSLGEAPGVALNNVTLTANTSSPALAMSFSEGDITNTIIAGNPGGGCSFADSFVASSHDLDGDGSCGFTDPGSLTGVDPHLGPLANNGGTTDTAALLSGSPAIDAGDDASCTPVDQRGVSRPQGAHCDIGAFELVNTTPPPDCSHATASPNQLWPPNHKFVPITISGVTNGPATISVTSIFQDEPVQSPGSGNTSPDATGVGTSSPSVRAERDGYGDGRVYHINFTATGAGGSCTGSVTVGVPHDQGHGGPVDQGALYNSTTP